jgi:hypothetical protein
MLCRIAAVVVGVAANLVLSCSEPARQTPARGAAQRNPNARAELVTLLDSANAPGGSRRVESGLSAGTRRLQFRSGEAQYSLEDLLQRAPELIDPRPWPGNAVIVVKPYPTIDYKIRVVKPDPTIDYKIHVVKPDPSIDYKIIVVGPPAPKPEPDLRERLREMLPQQPGPKSQKLGR